MVESLGDLNVVSEAHQEASEASNELGLTSDQVPKREQIGLVAVYGRGDLIRPDVERDCCICRAVWPDYLRAHFAHTERSPLRQNESGEVEAGHGCGLTFKVTGAARLYRAASRERSERGRPQGWASLQAARVNSDVRHAGLAENTDEITQRPHRC